MLKKTKPGEAGEGVEIFTNFQFYDQPPSLGGWSGLCNSYQTDPKTGQPTQTTAQEKRKDAFDAWTDFGWPR